MQVNLTQLHEALHSAFPSVGSFELFLGTMSRSWADFAGVGTTLPQGILAVVIEANAKGWLRPLLRALAASDAANNGKVMQFFQDNPDADPANLPAKVNPYISVFVHANKPFVGRPRLREQLPLLGQQTNSRILLVDGPRYSGKSYTHMMLEYMGTHLPCRAGYLMLDQQPFTLLQFAQYLQDRLEIKVPFPEKGNEQDSRWAERIADWFIANTRAADGSILWISIDGFRVYGDKDHEKGVFYLLDKLGEMIDSTAVSRCEHLRLVLINYGAMVAPSVEAGAFQEEVEAPVREAFEAPVIERLIGMGKSPAESSAIFREAYEQALSRANQAPEPEAVRLMYINIAMTKAINRTK